MTRRELIALLGSAATMWPSIANTQTASKVYRVGLLNPGEPMSDSSFFGAKMIRGFAKHGYSLDRNLTLERRGAQGHVERLPQLVAELVEAKVDVILVSSYPGALAAKQGTRTIPLVIWGVDPLATGLVDNLTRRSSNITGISDVSADLAAKRLEILKELVPQARKIAMLYNAADLGMTVRYDAVAAAAPKLGIIVQPLGVREPDDFETAFAAMKRDLPEAIFMVTDVLTILNRRRVYDFAAAYKLPAIYETELFARDGGLMSYGPDVDEIFERATDLIDHVLKGTEPGVLPFEQPARFRFVINLKTAKALGLTVPASLLTRADDLIE